MKTADTVDVIVTGYSLPALQAALDLAEVGLRVVVAAAPALVKPSSRPQRDEQGTIAAFYQRIAQPIEGTDGQVAAEALPDLHLPVSPKLRSADGTWANQPASSVLGIPAVPLSNEMFRLVGKRAALRAYFDRLKPLLTVGKTKMLGELVRVRMGGAVEQKLVEPHVRERFGAPADEIEVAVAAPGLNETLSRAGALSSAVLAYADRNVARETEVRAAGGAIALHELLRRRLEHYGVLFAEANAAEIHEGADQWLVTLEDESQLQGRALVLDQGDELVADPAISQLIGEVLPVNGRVYAEIDIEPVGWLEDGESALCMDGEWTLRVVKKGDRTTAYFSSLATARTTAAEIAERLVADAAAQELQSFELTELLKKWGFARALSAVWHIEHASAPFVSISTRSQQQQRLQDTQRQVAPQLLAVGQALHGDDLGTALMHAHTEVVALRRHLLGLADPMS